MLPIILISTVCSLHGPNQVFGESPLNFGTRRSSSEISATKDLNGRQTNQAKSFSNLGKFLLQAKTRTNPFLPKPGRLKFPRNKMNIINLILLPRIRDDIRANKKLNYHLYCAVKKAIYKPAAFFKGLLLPLAESACTLKEAMIVGSVMSKVSIPMMHSAAAMLKLTQLPYSGGTSIFLTVLMNKKYSLPYKVIDALAAHFASFQHETRVLPVLWHQSLLVFSQRYKMNLTKIQKIKSGIH